MGKRTRGTQDEQEPADRERRAGSEEHRIGYERLKQIFRAFS